MASFKPTFVFIPGAWHTPFYFTPVTDLLSSPPNSYPCVTIPLLSVLLPTSTSSTTLPQKPTAIEDFSAPLKSIEPDVEVIHKGIEAVLETGSDVVLVMHSYGGVPTAESMKYFQNDAGREGRGRILRMVWVCSFVVRVGGSLIEACGGDLPWWDVDRENDIVRPKNPKEVFYNDIPQATADPYITTLLPFSYRCMYSKTTYSPLATIPSTYVICEKDQAIPVKEQEGMIEAARASVGTGGGGGKVVPFDVVERLDAGHTPFISHTELLVEILVKAAASGGN